MGIGRSARCALVAGGSEDPSSLHSLPPCSISLCVKITKNKKADTFVPAFSVVTRTGNRRHCRTPVFPLWVSKKSLNGYFYAAILHKARSFGSKAIPRARNDYATGERKGGRPAIHRKTKSRYFCTCFSLWWPEREIDGIAAHPCFRCE